MTLDGTSLSPDFPTPVAPPRKRVLWKWAIVVTVVVLGFLMWQCGSALVSGRQMSNVAVQRFHDLLNDGDYEQIFAEADDGFQGSANKDQTLKFLQVVHNKLGKAVQPKLTNITVQATAGGTYVITAYSTKFEREENVVERFTWTRKNGQLKLHGYNVNSLVLVTE